jgi:hypothetical protein
VQADNLISVQQTDSEQASAMIKEGKRVSECQKRPDSQADTEVRTQA